MNARPATRAPRIDPRWYQIAMLSGLLLYGQLALGFGLSWAWIAAVIGACLLAQLAGTALTRLGRFDPLSALISGIGLCTLMRTQFLWIALLTAALAVGSKFVIRRPAGHLFNPTNFALALMLAFGAVWVSPGQYGHLAFAAFMIAGLGILVTTQASRGDVSWAFLGCWTALLFGRSLWLGEPPAIPLHRLQSGMLLQFAFNMISDPRTTPRSRAGRLLFGALVALGAYVVQFVLFRTNGPIWSLAAFTLLVPVIDRLLPGRPHEWRPSSPASTPTRGVTHEPRFGPAPAPAPAHGGALAGVRP
jgi:enediyne biosynthesis protein E5